MTVPYPTNSVQVAGKHVFRTFIPSNSVGNIPGYEDVSNGINALTIENGKVGIHTSPQFDLHVVGTFAATSIVGSGATLSNLNATLITSGTLDNARLPANISVTSLAGSGATLSNLNATLITAGTLDNARLPSNIAVTTLSGDGTTLSNLNATLITSGTLHNSLLPNAISVTTLSGSGATLSNLNATLITSGILDNARLPSAISVATLSGAGSTLSNLNATLITSGTLDNSRLPANVSVMSLSGDGSTLSNLNATLVTSGTLNNARLPANIAVTSISGDGTTLSNLNATLITSGTLDATHLAVSGVSAGTYGSASSVAVVTVDSKGRVTSANSTNIAINAAAVSGLATVATSGDYNDLTNKTFTLSGTNAVYTSGNVGISTTSVLNTLDVRGNMALGTYAGVANAPTNGLIVSGSMGIGVNNPTAKLHVDGDIVSTGTMIASNLLVLGDTVTLNTTTSNTENLIINNAGTGPALDVIQSGNQPIARFIDDSNVALLIADGGYVGINTNVPRHYLDVVGSAIITNTVFASAFQGSGATLSNLNATYITTGTLDNARLPSAISVATISGSGATLSNLNATNVTSGTIDNARLPSVISVSTLSGDGASLSNLNATLITSGTIDNARLPTAIAVSTLSGSGATLSNLNATLITSGTLDNARLPSSIAVTSLAGSGASLSNLNAFYITSGSLANARLPPAFSVNTNTNTLVIDASSNVGIGTTNPLAKLHVQGNINFTGDLYKNNELLRMATYGITYNSSPVIYNTLVDSSGYHANLYDFVNTSQYLSFGSNVAVSSNQVYDGSLVVGSVSTTFTFNSSDPVAMAPASAFTYEAWIYPIDGTSEFRFSNGNTGVWMFSGNALQATIFTPYGNPAVGAYLSYNTWTHVAYTSANQTLYINGVSQGSIGVAGEYFDYTVSGVTLQGKNVQVSNVRITKATVYSSNFTPSSAPLTSLTNTRLLVRAPPTFVTPNISTDSNLFVGIGTSTPTHKLEVLGEIYGTSNVYGSQVQLLSRGTAASPAVTWQAATDTGIFSPSSNHIALSTGGTETLRIASSGNIGIGTTIPNYRLHVEGKVFASDSITAYSDARVKTNVQTIHHALAKVMALRGVEYERLDTGEKQIGVIAQEILPYLPQVVTAGENGLSVAYGNIVGLLIESIKELTGHVRYLEDRINNFMQ